MFGFTSEKTKLKKENLILRNELEKMSRDLNESRDLVRRINESSEKHYNKLFDIQVAFNKGIEDTPSLKRYTVIKKLNNIING